MDTYKTIEYRGYEIQIGVDEFAEDPRSWDNLGTMAFFHKRYNLGDKDHGLSIEQAQEIEESNNYICLPVYMYDHSGITINTTGFSCPWDSGKLGIIFISKKRARKEYGDKYDENKIREYLKVEVKTYDQYLRGDVYFFSIEDGDTHVDSCHGFFGDEFEENGLLEYARNGIDVYIHQQEKTDKFENSCCAY